MKRIGDHSFRYERSKLFSALAAILFGLFISVSLLSCKSTPKTDVIGTWIIRKTSYDTTDHSERGLAARVWASTLAGGSATWEFMPNDSAIVIYPPDNDQRHYFYALQPDGSTIILEDNDLKRTDTLETKLNRDTLRITDRSRGIDYIMTRGGAKMNESP